MSEQLTVDETLKALAHIIGSGKLPKNIEMLFISAHTHIEQVKELEAQLEQAAALIPEWMSRTYISRTAPNDEISADRACAYELQAILDPQEKADDE